MKEEEITKIVQDPNSDRWLIWAGFILEEDVAGRDIEYFGRFVKTKRAVIGIVRSMIDNTSPYRIIIQDTAPFKDKEIDYQTELKDFFPLERLEV